MLQEYDKYKQELINVERNLLRTFGFILHVDHPHKFVLNYLMLLDTSEELLQEAWNIANDRHVKTSSGTLPPSLESTLSHRCQAIVASFGRHWTSCATLSYTLEG